MVEDIANSYFKDWPLKIENDRKAAESKRNNLVVSLGYPVKTSIDTTTACNLHCTMCKYHGQDKIVSETLPFRTFKKVTEQLFPYCKELHLGIKGESMLTSYFKRIPSILQEYGVRLNLTTNGMLLSSEISNLIMPVLRDVKISFDGAKKSTFENIRKGANYELILDNIKEFIRLRDKYVSRNKTKKDFYRPTITLQTVLMKDNIKELPDIVKIAYKFGVDRVKGFNLMVIDKRFLQNSLLFDQKNANKYLIRAFKLVRAFKLQTKYQDLFDLNYNIFSSRDENNSSRNCNFLWRQINIEVDGNIRSCCHLKSPLMGSIHANSIMEIWNNKKYQEMRRRLNSQNPFECCRNCAMLHRKVTNAKAFIFCNLDNIKC